jgi:hypothetical protein
VKTLLPSVLRLALLFGTGTAVSAAASIAIPLIQGLTLVGAASERQGDYESTDVIDGVDADGTLHLDTSADIPDPAGGKAKAVNDSLATLAAWHVKGDFVQGTASVPIEWYVLDDPVNPLTQLDISERRMSDSGFGASAPRGTNATLAGRGRNRLVELTRE